MTTSVLSNPPVLPDDTTLSVERRSDEPWSRLRLADASSLPSVLVERGAQVRERHAILAAALDTEAMVRFMEFAGPLLDPEQGFLPHEERELVATVVSAENRCTGCLLSHVRKLGEAIGDELLAHRIAVNYRQVHLSERERALADLAAKLTVTPYAVEDDDIERLKRAGLSDEAIHQAIVVIALTNYSNRLSSGLGSRPDDDFFAPASVVPSSSS